MKKTLIAMGVLGAFSSLAFAASNVTLYGIIEEGVIVQKAKHGDNKVELNSGFGQGSRWGIKGVEDLGNGYSAGFVLEQGFNADNGNEATSGKAFNRESFLYVKGGFGSFGFGRTGALSFAQTQAILTGWAFGTSYGASSWQSAIANNFSRMDNVLSYATPSFNGFTGHVMYSNGLTSDSEKWSDNNHYYGIGAKYTAHNIDASIIFEAKDNKGVALLEEKQKALYHITAGGTYNFNGVKPGVIYQYATQEDYYHQHAFGLSVTAPLAGGSAKLGAKYLLRKYDSHYVDLAALSEKKASVWTVGAGYEYPFSKRTNLWTYAGYADGAKGWKNEADVNYNGWQVGLGLLHKF